MPRGSGPVIHLSVPGNTQSRQMRLLQQLTGKPISVILPNALLISYGSSAGETTSTMAQGCRAIFLFIFFQAYILSPIRLDPARFIHQVVSATGKTGVKCPMFY